MVVGTVVRVIGVNISMLMRTQRIILKAHKVFVKHHPRNQILSTFKNEKLY